MVALQSDAIANLQRSWDVRLQSDVVPLRSLLTALSLYLPTQRNSVMR